MSEFKIEAQDSSGDVIKIEEIDDCVSFEFTDWNESPPRYYCLYIKKDEFEKVCKKFLKSKC